MFYFINICRPHWEKCGQYIEGGIDRWNELSQDRSSDELVDILLAEMTGQDIAIIQAGVNTGAEYFTGQVNWKETCIMCQLSIVYQIKYTIVIGPEELRLPLNQSDAAVLQIFSCSYLLQVLSPIALFGLSPLRTGKLL